MTKIETIQTLERQFMYNPEFKKQWQDYIELCILEAFEDKAPHVGQNAVNKVVKDSSERIMRLFDTEWWAAQQ